MHYAWLIDLAVVVGYFALIMGIGLYMGRREDNLHDFALGGRRIPWWAVLASIIAAETSAGTFFGTPNEGYTYRNFTFMQLTHGHDHRARAGELYFHQALLPVQRLLHLRVPDVAVWDRDQERCLGTVSGHARARQRIAALRCGHRAGAGVRTRQRRATLPRRNPYTSTCSPASRSPS